MLDESEVVSVTFAAFDDAVGASTRFGRSLVAIYLVLAPDYSAIGCVRKLDFVVAARTSYE